MRIQDEFVKQLKTLEINLLWALREAKVRCRILDVRYVRLVLAGIFIWLFVTEALGGEVTGQVAKVGDATHVEFRGQDQWSYELDKAGDSTIRLVVPPFDAATEATLKTWSDSLVKAVKIDKNGKDGKFVVTFELADKQVESFDYLTDDPSRLIVDFYKADQATAPVAATTPTPAKVKTKRAAKAKPNNQEPQETASEGYTKRNTQRDPAGSELLSVVADPNGAPKATELSSMTGVFDGNDPAFSRFQIKDHEVREEAIIASKQNIYIRFPMLEMPASELKRLMENAPEYGIRPKEEEENKQARFLLTLFTNNRNAAFLKTYDFFIRKYPTSIYDEIVRNMSAEVHYRLFRETNEALHFSKAKGEYEYLLAKYPESPLAERTELFLGYMNLERNDPVTTLQIFQRFLATRPGSPDRDKAQRAVGVAYLQLKKFEDAAKAFQDMEKAATDKEMAKEATYRLGDVAFARRDYGDAIKLYEEALKKYPEAEAKFANLHYNMGEALFWTGSYRLSLDNYLAFLRLFPAHDHGGYAITRVGELMEIMGVDQSRVMGAFLESYFRFRESPGAQVARVRMLSQRMKGMKENELTRSVDEMKKIGEGSDLPKMNEFVSLMIADGYHRRGEYDQALDFLVTYYRQNPTSSNLNFFQRRILRNITDDMSNMIARNDFMKTLDTFSKYSATWLKNPDRLDVPYFLGQAYEKAGVFSEAERIYGSLLVERQKIVGTEQEKERRVNEHLPSADEIFLRLSTVAAKQRKVTMASQNLAQIKAPDQLKAEEQIEWIENMALVAEEKGMTKEAIGHLTKLTANWQNQPQYLPPVYLRLAEMQFKAEQFADAEGSLNLLRDMKQNKIAVDDPVLAKALERRGDVLLKQGKSVAAVEAYLELLDQFEDKRPLSYIRYKAGSILYETGDLKGAEKIWASLDGKNGEMYRRLANERLAQAQWQDDYKKYVNRIPAMSGAKKGR